MLLSACGTMQYSSTNTYDDVYYKDDQSVKSNDDRTNFASNSKSGNLTDADLLKLREESLRILNNDTLGAVDTLIYYDENKNPYDKILVDDVTEALERRRQGSQNPYRGINNYYFLLTDDAFWYASAYDPAFYNIVVMGTDVWVEPNWVSAALGNSWGVSYNPYRTSWGWGLGYMGSWPYSYYSYNPYYPYYSWPTWGYYSTSYYNNYYAPYSHASWARRRIDNHYYGRTPSDQSYSASNYTYRRLSGASTRSIGSDQKVFGRSEYNVRDQRTSKGKRTINKSTDTRSNQAGSGTRRTISRSVDNRNSTRVTRSANSTRTAKSTVRTNSTRSRFSSNSNVSGNTQTTGRSARTNTGSSNLRSTSYSAPRRSTDYSQSNINRRIVNTRNASGSNNRSRSSNSNYRRSSSNNKGSSIKRSSSGSSTRTSTRSSSSSSSSKSSTRSSSSGGRNKR